MTEDLLRRIAVLLGKVVNTPKLSVCRRILELIQLFLNEDGAFFITGVHIHEYQKVACQYMPSGLRE
ncbi:CEI_1a_G0022470.mRNA.1.CDS.1 [Saccharomyces cerevisiae]|nr:EM14S01-3B_G0035530.mRNA.1.CDS.1 [Saccharomyces cerevisiae]CAI4501927.1 AMH_1a_G0022550.mRNA.1.CDS.1 [Saccharomyces cerevisiae]CAI4511585.1 CEI_1a_G0022470.mRNA.1.CDS.1 [Saccharomyces cerevisiae]CAI6694765.1 AMH_1a_G0022550.mRNA.1.CDS.1 [Saccharomyces cerevisiae]CAI7319152.1 CEI_1a_G0022470.mRNA.1.CDS.1 [Saccharomyces cerevisiae]